MTMTVEMTKTLIIAISDMNCEKVGGNDDVDDYDDDDESAEHAGKPYCQHKMVGIIMTK